jgi:hypothetical protein
MIDIKTITESTPITTIVKFKLCCDGINDGTSNPIITLPYQYLHVRSDTNTTQWRTDVVFLDSSGSAIAPGLAIGKGNRNVHKVIGTYSIEPGNFVLKTWLDGKVTEATRTNVSFVRNRLGVDDVYPLVGEYYAYVSGKRTKLYSRFGGTIYEYYIFTRVLSQEEIDNYNTNDIVPTDYVWSHTDGQFTCKCEATTDSTPIHNISLEQGLETMGIVVLTTGTLAYIGKMLK